MISTLGNQNVLIIIFIFFVSFISAQSTDQFYHKNPHHVLSGDDIVLSVTMFTSDPIVSGMLFFDLKIKLVTKKYQCSFQMAIGMLLYQEGVSKEMALNT